MSIAWKANGARGGIVGTIGGALFLVDPGVGNFFQACFHFNGDGYSIVDTAKSAEEAKSMCEWLARAYNLEIGE